MSLQLGVLAALGAMLFWGAGDFLIQRSTRKLGDIESLAFIGIIGSIGLLPFVISELPLLFSLPNLLLLSFIGVLTFAAAVPNLEAWKQGKLSVIEVILEIELPITAILGFVFLREMPSVPQMTLIFAILAGIVLVSVSSFSHRHWRPLRSLEKGFVFAVIAAVGLAFIDFLTAVGSKQVSPIMVIWVPWVVLSAICLAFISRREGLGRLARNASRFRMLIIGMGLLDTLAWLLYAVALSRNALAVTTAITESYPAIGIFLGVLLNRERVMTHQYAGAAVALGASFLLALIV